ncbi:MAG: GNAT family N-acetyltransferase [Anaerolineae bacterium]|nr:GNAT family N-acetyltransferase [Anaerolineae bacterium]
MLNTTIMRGQDLSEAQIDFMNKQRLMEYGENTKDFKKNELASIFFFLDQAESVKAFGMLKPLNIIHDGKQCPILGISNIIAVEKGRGYGKLLMQAIKEYLVSKHMNGLGFCDHEICPFYVQCGFQIIEGLSSRFQYLYAQQDGQKEKLDSPRGTIYFEGRDKLASKLLANDEPIYIDVPFW